MKTNIECRLENINREYGEHYTLERESGIKYSLYNVDDFVGRYCEFGPVNLEEMDIYTIALSTGYDYGAARSHGEPRWIKFDMEIPNA